MHWADYVAKKIIKERGDKEEYVVESGISPSGYVHIGNFRELFTAYIVGKALRDKGKKIRHIHMWDDYDYFRKVPKNIPKEWAQYLKIPLSEVPDPWGCHKSYGHHFMDLFEEEVARLGIEVEFLHAAQLYKRGEYASEVRLALERRNKIIDVLNKYRDIAKRPHLEESWQPVQIYCPKCRKEAEFVGWDGEWKIKYKCQNCGSEGWTDIRDGNVKLKWRVDWPMRWAHFNVDFEPAGKDHMAAGSSWDTGQDIIKEVFEKEGPIGLMYEFVGIRGQKGKMSGSKGNVILLSDLYEVLEPGVIRFVYAKHRANKEIKIDLGLDLLNIYDEFDKVERIYFGVEKVKNKAEEQELKRTYELSMPRVPEKLPVQAPFRFLAVLVQMPHIDNERIIEILQRQGHVPTELNEKEVARIKLRIQLAKNWVKKYAPEQVKFVIQKELPRIEIGEQIKEALRELADYIESKEDIDVNELNFNIYEVAKKRGIPSKEYFKILYMLLIGKERGPRMAGFLASLDKEFVVKRLRLES